MHTCVASAPLADAGGKLTKKDTAFETHGPNVKPLAQSAVSVRLYTRWARPDGTRTLVEDLAAYRSLLRVIVCERKRSRYDKSMASAFSS